MSNAHPYSERTSPQQPETDAIDLFEDESVLDRTHPHLLLWKRHFLLIAVLAIANTLLPVGTDAILASSLLSAGILLHAFAVQRISHYLITSERLHSRVGLLSSTRQECRLEDVHAFTVDQSLLGRLFGYGTLTVQLGTNNTLRWRGVPEPQTLVSRLRTQQHRH